MKQIKLSIYEDGKLVTAQGLSLGTEINDPLPNEIDWMYEDLKNSYFTIRKSLVKGDQPRAL